MLTNYTGLLATYSHFVVPVLITTILIVSASLLFRKSKFNPDGKHCYITGGSAGLGLALAEQLAREGAHITIIARNVPALEKAEEIIKRARRSEEQRVQWIAADVSIREQAIGAVRQAKEGFRGIPPEYVFLCAGAARPRYFVLQDLDEFEQGMQVNYFGALYTTHETARQMILDDVKGSVVFVSSTLGYMSIPGYSQYTPPKHALRGLVDCLSGEFLFYGISMHCFFPGNIDTPGYKAENETKPAFTKELDEADLISASFAAKVLLKGLRKGQTHITSDLITDLFRCMTSGATPSNYPIIDGILAIIGWPIVRIWAMSLYSRTRKLGVQLMPEHRAQIEEMLEKQKEQ